MNVNMMLDAAEEFMIKPLDDTSYSMKLFDDDNDETVFINDFNEVRDDGLPEEISDDSAEICVSEKSPNTMKLSRIKRKSSSNENAQAFVHKDKLVKAIEEAGTLFGLNNYIDNTKERWESKKINVAVTGNSGAGKSSLINAVRGVKPKAIGAAPVGIRETTTKIQKYEFPESDKVVLWDLPGMGTEKFRQETYIKDMELSTFDIVVVVTATRFLENDVWLAKQALSLDKNVIFVRTKLDFDLMNASRDNPDTFNKDKCIEEIRKDIEKYVNSYGIAESSDGIYLVSNPERGNYDFPSLIKKLRGLMNIKGISICRLIQHHMEKIVKTKRESVRREFTSSKVISAMYGFLPVPKLETVLNHHVVEKIRNKCLQKFNLDDKALSKFSEEIDLSVDTLKAYHLSAFNTEQLTHVDKLYTQSEEFRFSKFRRYSKYMVPIVGSVLSACKAPHTIQDCVDIICNIMAEDEYYLVQLRLEKLEKQLRPLL